MTSSTTMTIEPGKPEKSGRGGNGGTGGNGGDIELIYCDSEALAKVNIDVSGGVGGIAGSDGSVLNEDSVYDSPPGIDGKNGKDGIIIYIRIRLEELRNYFQNKDILNFDMNRIISLSELE